MRIIDLIKGANILIKGECSDELIAQTAHDLDYHNPRDYKTADRACKYLCVSRDTFYKQIVPKYKLKNHKFGNAHIGFYVGDLKKVKADLEKQK